jgi:hypothetical protein
MAGRSGKPKWLRAAARILTLVEEDKLNYTNI